MLLLQKKHKKPLESKKKVRRGKKVYSVIVTFGIEVVTIEQIVKKSVFGQILTTFALNSNKTTKTNCGDFLSAKFQLRILCCGYHVLFFCMLHRYVHLMWSGNVRNQPKKEEQEGGNGRREENINFV